MKKLKRNTHKKNKTIPAIIVSCLALILLFGGLFLAKNPEILKAITGQQEILDASPFNVRPFEDSEKGKPFREKKYNELKHAKKKDLGVDVTPVPHRFVNNPPTASEGNYFIEGEYAFFPRWRKNVTKAIVVQDGKPTKIYDDTAIEQKIEFTKKQIDAGPDKNYVVFTHMGVYKGKPISIKMTPVEVPEIVTIGVSNEPILSGNDVTVSSAMSISKTSTLAYRENLKTSYVKMKYTFYDCTNEKIDVSDLQLGDPIKVRGFLTYIDFDHEESVGYSKDAKMQRAYFLKADKGDPDYLVEPPISKPDLYYDYMVRYENYLSDYYTQLLYKKADDYLFINRGWRANTNARTQGNWFQFTYGETEGFDVLVSAPPFSHRLSYRAMIEDDDLLPGYIAEFEAADDESVYDGTKELASFFKNNRSLFQEDPTKPKGGLKIEWERWSAQRMNSTGTTVGFAPETLLPILFPNPVKTADQDTEDEIITWEINQAIPARKFKNAEPKFTVTDEIDGDLIIDSVKIRDAGGTDVTNATVGVGAKKCWEIIKTGNKITIEASKEFLTDPNEEFYANNFVFEIKTRLDRSKNYMTHYDKTKKSLVFYNQSKLTTANLDMSDREIDSKPDYDEPVGPTEGLIDVEGNLEILKVDEKTGDKLQGAEFQLIDSENKTDPLWKGKTDGNGKLVLPTGGTKIKGGEYTLKEVSPPPGYEPVADQKVMIGFETKITIENKKAKEIGKFDKPVKKVTNLADTDIDGKLVSRGETINYQIEVKDDNSKLDTLIKKAVLTDVLSKDLELVPNTTYLTLKPGGTKEKLVDADVWKTSGSTKKLTTAEYDLGSGEGFVVEWQVTVKQTATNKIENEGTVTGEGYKPGQTAVEKISATTNKVVNHLATPIHLRQIILEPHTSIVVPKAPADPDYKDEKYGFFQLNNLDATNKSVERLNVMVHSDEGISKTTYTTVSIAPKDNNLDYSIEPVIPEMYKIKGYAQTEIKNQGQSDIKNVVGVYPKIKIDSEKEQYITVIIEPTLKKAERPPFYNWNYHLNVFPQEIE